MYRIERFYLYLSLFIFAFLQEGLILKISVFNVFPDIVLSLVVFCGLFFGPLTGFEAGIVAGFLKDVMGIGLFGANIVFLGLVGVLCGILSDKVYKENPFPQFFLVLSFSLIYTRMQLTFSLYTALVAPLLFFILQAIFISVEKLEDF